MFCPSIQNISASDYQIRAAFRLMLFALQLLICLSELQTSQTLSVNLTMVNKYVIFLQFCFVLILKIKSGIIYTYAAIPTSSGVFLILVSDLHLQL